MTLTLKVLGYVNVGYVGNICFNLFQYKSIQKPRLFKDTAAFPAIQRRDRRPGQTVETDRWG